MCGVFESLQFANPSEMKWECLFSIDKLGGYLDIKDGVLENLGDRIRCLFLDRLEEGVEVSSKTFAQVASIGSPGRTVFVRDAGLLVTVKTRSLEVLKKALGEIEYMCEVCKQFGITEKLLGDIKKVIRKVQRCQKEECFRSAGGVSVWVRRVEKEGAGK